VSKEILVWMEREGLWEGRELSEEEGVPVHREIPGHSEHSGSQERKAQVDLEECPVTRDFPGP